MHVPGSRETPLIDNFGARTPESLVELLKLHWSLRHFHLTSLPSLSPLRGVGSDILLGSPSLPSSALPTHFPSPVFLSINLFNSESHLRAPWSMQLSSDTQKVCDLKMVTTRSPDAEFAFLPWKTRNRIWKSSRLRSRVSFLPYPWSRKIRLCWCIWEDESTLGINLGPTVIFLPSGQAGHPKQKQSVLLYKLRALNGMSQNQFSWRNSLP